MLNHDPAARTHNRLGFLLIIILAVHAAIILGVGFFLNAPKARPAKRIDITLSHFHEKQPIIDADFLAQSNQSASGTESNKKEMTTTEVPLINSSVDTPIQTVSLESREQAKDGRRNITSASGKQKTSDNFDTTNRVDPSQTKGEDRIDQRQIEISALKAKLAQQKQAYARLPKTRRLSSVATKSAADAAYLYKWQQRVELIGNQHYPKQARKQGLYGSLQVLVSIDKNGQLLTAEVLKSSGHPSLDQAALRIVRLASPFDPLPKEVLKEANVLEIVRTWKFQKNRFSQGQ